MSSLGGAVHCLAAGLLVREQLAAVSLPYANCKMLLAMKLRWLRREVRRDRGKLIIRGFENLHETRQLGTVMPCSLNF